MKRKTLGIMALALSLTYLPALAEAPVATQPVDLTYAAEKR